MPSVIRVEEQRHGTTVVASLDGELDASSVGDVMGAFAALKDIIAEAEGDRVMAQAAE